MTSKQKLIDLLAERSRKHDAFRIAESAGGNYHSEMNAFDIAHGEVLDWLNDTDHLDELLGLLRPVETSVTHGDSNAKQASLAGHSADASNVEPGNLANPRGNVPARGDQQQPASHAGVMFRSYPAASGVAELIKSRLFQTFLGQGFWHAHHVDLIWRYNGQDVREEADWLKDLWYAIKGAGETTCEWSEIEDGSGVFNTCKAGEEWHVPEGLEPFPFCHWCGKSIVVAEPAACAECGAAWGEHRAGCSQIDPADYQSSVKATCDVPHVMPTIDKQAQ